MGYAARTNGFSRQGKPLPDQDAVSLRRMLNLFPDRTTFEQWVTGKQFDRAIVAHLEAHLPPRLQQQGTV